MMLLVGDELRQNDEQEMIYLEWATRITFTGRTYLFLKLTLIPTHQYESLIDIERSRQVKTYVLHSVFKISPISLFSLGTGQVGRRLASDPTGDLPQGC